LYKLTPGSVAYHNAHFGMGSGPIFLDQLLCSGSEHSLLDCPSTTTLGLHNCDHSMDASVMCRGKLKSVRFCLDNGTISHGIEFVISSGRCKWMWSRNCSMSPQCWLYQYFCELQLPMQTRFRRRWIQLHR